MLGNLNFEEASITAAAKIQNISLDESKDMDVSPTNVLVNRTGFGSVMRPLEAAEKRVLDTEKKIEVLEGDIEELKSEIKEVKSKIKNLETKKQASTLTVDEQLELSNATELRIMLEKSRSACLNELSLLRSQLMKEADALKLLQSSSGVSEMIKVVKSGFETQIQDGVPSKLETPNLLIGDEAAANDLAQALSYDLIDASHPLLKTREGCKAYVKFKQSFASSKQCLSLCCNLVSCSIFLV